MVIRLRWQWIFLLIVGWFAIMFIALSGLQQAIAQGPTPTSLSIVIPTRTATLEIQLSLTPSRTAAPEGPTTGRVEAKDAATGANIRASPSTDAEKLGNIRPGKFYAIVGRSDKWLEIQFPDSPTGLGWVYEDLVSVTGLTAGQIPTLDQQAIPSPNVATAAAQQTAAYLTETPGAPETATILAASATGVFTRLAPGDTPNAAQSGEALPTFTFPPPFVEATLPARGSLSASQVGLPPIVPIIALGGLGLFGLFVAALRRL